VLRDWLSYLEDGGMDLSDATIDDLWATIRANVGCTPKGPTMVGSKIIR
jgi:hypothetical protein